MKKSIVWTLISVVISLVSLGVSVFALVYQHDANVKTDATNSCYFFNFNILHTT